MVSRSKIVRASPTRRQFGTTLGGATMAMALSRRSLAQSGSDLAVLTWSGYEDPGLHQPYIAKHDVSPTFTFIASGDEMIAKLQAGLLADVAHPCSETLPRLRDSGLIRPIDTSRIHEWGNLFEHLRAIETGGDRHFVPFDWGADGLIVNADSVDRFEVENLGWSALIDQKFKDNAAMRKTVESLVAVSALIAGSSDPFVGSAATADAAEPIAISLVNSVRRLWSAESDLIQAMATGEVSIAYGWQSTVRKLRDAGVNAVFIAPFQGPLLWVCGPVIAANAQYVDLAYDFIEAMLDPGSGRFLMENFGFLHSNTRSFDGFDHGPTTGIDDPRAVLSSGKTWGPIPDDVLGRFASILNGIN